MSLIPVSMYGLAVQGCCHSTITRSAICHASTDNHASIVLPERTLIPRLGMSGLHSSRRSSLFVPKLNRRERIFRSDDDIELGHGHAEAEKLGDCVIGTLTKRLCATDRLN